MTLVMDAITAKAATRRGQGHASGDLLERDRELGVLRQCLERAGAVRTRFPQADMGLCTSCAEASGGNPFLLTELLTAIAEDEETRTATRVAHKRVEEIVPYAVRESVGARLESASPAARAVAEAVAVLDDGAPVARVARLAALDSAAVLSAAKGVPGASASMSHAAM